MRVAPNFRDVQPFWKVNTLGGPIDAMSLTDSESLKDFAQMDIEFEFGGGLYLLKDVK